MNLFDEYKELYYKEIEFSDRLNNKITTCITLLTITGTGLIFLWMQLTTNFLLHWKYSIYGLLCLISLFFFIRSLYFFYKAYVGYQYSYFPVKAIRESIDATFQYTNGKENGDDMAVKHIESMFKERFITDAISNRQENAKKNQNHRNLTIWIIRSFVVILIAFAYEILFINPLINDIQLVKLIW